MLRDHVNLNTKLSHCWEQQISFRKVNKTKTYFAHYVHKNFKKIIGLHANIVIKNIMDFVHFLKDLLFNRKNSIISITIEKYIIWIVVKNLNNKNNVYRKKGNSF